MTQKSVAILGGCMVVGWELPATKSLPVLVKRALKRQACTAVKILADDQNDSIEKLCAAAARTAREYPDVDAIVLQFINMALVPHLDWQQGFQKNTLRRFAYRILKNLEQRLPKSSQSWLRIHLLRQTPRTDYLPQLRMTVEKLRAELPQARLLLMTPVPPTSPALRPVTKRFDVHRDGITRIAREYNAEVVDIYSALAQYPPADVLCLDGYHLTAQGQHVVAETITQILLANPRNLPT
jgi:hypothetical protein